MQIDAKTIDFEGKKIAYYASGKGEAVVLLHGFCEQSKMWINFKEDLLEEACKVVCIDLPGFGKSEPVSPGSIDKMAEAVNQVVETLKLKKIVIIGHSMGGYVSLAYAEKYGEKLNGLGLFHSFCYPDTPEKKEARLKNIDFIKRQGHALYVKELIPKLFAPGAIRKYSYVIDVLIHQGSESSAEGIIEALIAMRERPDRSEVLKNIKCPVLFIIGKEDIAVPFEMSMEQVELPDTSVVHILDKIGHMGMFEAENKTKKMVRDFVDFCGRCKNGLRD